MSKKIQRIVQLTGLTVEGEPAKTHQADQVVGFGNKNFQVCPDSNGDYRLRTAARLYVLSPHATIKNLYTGTCNGIKVHFCPKKIVAKLIYWA